MTTAQFVADLVQRQTPGMKQHRQMVEQVGRLADEVDLPAGRVAARQGTSGDEFFLILEGTVRIERDGQLLRDLGPGDYFGEIALIDGGPRSGTVTAITDLVCYGLTFWEFRPLVERNGSIGWKLLQVLAKRLRGST